MAASATRTPSTGLAPAFFSDSQWEGLADWEAELRPHYDTAERMLGVTEYEGMTAADELLREYAGQIGVGDTFEHTPRRRLLRRAGQAGAGPIFRG